MNAPRVSRVLLAACGLSIFALAGCRTSVQELLDRPRLSPGVAMQDVNFYSKALQRQMPYRVFLPAKVESGRKLPVVYLLHGGGGSYRDWSNYSDVCRYAARGLILVMPAGDSSYYMNAAQKPEDRYEDYLVSDLTADVEARFPAAAGRESRAIVGVSMGGFAAVKLALTRPELFAFAGAISPAIDVPSRRFTLRRWGQYIRFRSIFGPWASKTRLAADPFVLVQSAHPAVTPYLYLTAGEQEALLAPNRRFAAILREQRFNFEFHTKPGGHDWNQWDAQLPGCFESLQRNLPASTYPTAMVR